MELAEGTELFDEIVKRRSFSEEDAKNLIRKLLDAAAYLHDQNIIHRDLKPENIIFTQDSKTNISDIKIVDFGFARNCDELHPLRTPAGTLGYKAPELFKTLPYTTKADMWSIGVICYILLCGFPPFFSCESYKDEDMLLNAPFWFLFNDETDSLIEAIKTGKIDFPKPFWDNISDLAKSFIKTLLVVDPANRSSAKEALQHPWILYDKPLTKALCVARLLQKTSSFNKEVTKKMMAKSKNG